MDSKRKQPIGIELVKRGIVTEEDVERALDYQKAEPRKKIGDILNILRVCDPYVLIEAIGEILDEKANLEKELEFKYERWEYLNNLAEEIANSKN